MSEPITKYVIESLVVSDNPKVNLVLVLEKVRLHFHNELTQDEITAVMMSYAASLCPNQSTT